MEELSSKITVSGNIVSELSDKIPSNIVALNELIKNAYDAGSPSVEIFIDSESKTITIRDYGVGMDIGDVNKLLHISSSEKEYGKEVCIKDFQRITQGSKGLGFLSVFKFGNKVSWQTGKKNILLQFSLDFNELIKQENISNYPMKISKSTNSDFIGTEIKIEVDKYNLETLKEYFNEEKNINKVLNSFVIEDEKNIITDQNFIINLKMDSKEVSTNTTLKIEEEHKEAQLLRVKFNSEDGKVNFFYKNQLVYSRVLEYDFKGFSLNLDVQIYSLKSHGKSKINALFYNPITEELTPLIYVNNNLFNNYSIFDTSIMKYIKLAQSLPQIIGFISIKSFDKDVSFNSDRTQFTQNELTDNIIKIVESLNKEIQISGSQIRDELKGDFLPKNLNSLDEDKIIENFTCENVLNKELLLGEFVQCEKTEDEIKFSLFDYQRVVRIKKKEKKETIKNFDIFIGQDNSEIVKEIEQVSKTFSSIKSNSKNYKEIEWNSHGEWLLTSESDNEIIKVILRINQPEQPKITVLVTDVELHKPYHYNDLFKVENSFGEKDKNISFKLETYGNPNINHQKNKAIVSFDTLDDAKVTISITDKVTNLSHCREEYFRVNDPSKKITGKLNDSSKDFIRMPVSSAESLPSSIKSFIVELNSLADNEEYSYTFVSSVRTLVELCTIDILNLKNILKKESLAENYKIVVNSYAEFLEKIEDEKNKQVIKNLVQSVGSSVDRDSFLAFLNLSTHGSARIITKSEVRLKTKEIGVLLEYLNFLRNE